MMGGKCASSVIGLLAFVLLSLLLAESSLAASHYPRSLLQDTENIDGGAAFNGEEAPKDLSVALGALQKDEAGETRSLPMFDYVVSCVPIRVLVLAQSAADKEVVGYDASAPEFGIWISAPADVSKALRAEVTNSTLFLDFVDGDFATDQPIKLIVFAPEESLRGVHNAGVISTMVVMGFSPPEEFTVINSSPFGALIVDDINATKPVVVRNDGSGDTAILGKISTISVASRGTTGDILVDGVDKELTVDLQGTGNVIVDGTENVLITGNFLGSAGIVSFTRGTCMLKSSFVDERAAAEAVAADEDTMGMLTGCVKIPPSMTMEEAAPNVDEHMYWTCGLRVRGTFDCMRGGMEGSRPGGRRIEITGRAWHGYPTSTCSEDVDPEGLPMASVVEGMEVKELPNSSDGDRMARARSSIGREFDVLEVPQ